MPGSKLMTTIALAAVFVAVAASVSALGTTNGAGVDCSKFWVQSQCLNASSNCGWCGWNLCYDKRKQTCCEGQTGLCHSSNETCCTVTSPFDETTSVCCARNTTKCCQGMAEPMCCDEKSICCPIAARFAGGFCCHPDRCLMGMCCSEDPVNCGGTPCCRSQCFNNTCSFPPP